MLSPNVQEIIEWIKEMERLKLRSNKKQSLQEIGVEFEETSNSIIAKPYSGRTVTFEYDGEKLIQTITKDRFRRKIIKEES